MNKEEQNYIFGIRAIMEAIEAGKTIDKLFIQKGLRNDLFAKLWKLVRLKRINYKHVPVEKIKEFESDYIQFLHSKHQNVLDQLAAGKLTEEITSVLEKSASELTLKYVKKDG